MIVGYRRVSSVEQNFARQELGKVDRTFEEKESGGKADRVALNEMLSFVRDGDEIVCFSIDRLARNLSDLQSIIKTVNDKGVGIRFISENLSFDPNSNDAFARLQLQMMGAFAEFERNIIRKRQADGIRLAKERGVYKGRKKVINSDKIKALREEGLGATVIAQQIGCSRQSVYRALG